MFTPLRSGNNLVKFGKNGFFLVNHLINCWKGVLRPLDSQPCWHLPGAGPRPWRDKWPDHCLVSWTGKPVVMVMNLIYWWWIWQSWCWWWILIWCWWRPQIIVWNPFPPLIIIDHLFSCRSLILIIIDPLISYRESSFRQTTSTKPSQTCQSSYTLLPSWPFSFSFLAMWVSIIFMIIMQLWPFKTWRYAIRGCMHRDTLQWVRPTMFY